MRVPVFGRGCAGGVSGLALGPRLARAEPGEVVLVVVVELCTLTSRTDRGTKADVISSALFGDGSERESMTQKLGFAQFNAGRLRAEGGVEFGATHYPLMIALRRCLFTEFVSKTRRWPRLRRRREY